MDVSRNHATNECVHNGSELVVQFTDYLKVELFRGLAVFFILVPFFKPAHIIKGEPFCDLVSLLWIQTTVLDLFYLRSCLVQNWIAGFNIVSLLFLDNQPYITEFFREINVTLLFLVSLLKDLKGIGNLVFVAFD